MLGIARTSDTDTDDAGRRLQVVTVCSRSNLLQRQMIIREVVGMGFVDCYRFVFQKAGVSIETRYSIRCRLQLDTNTQNVGQGF